MTDKCGWLVVSGGYTAAKFFPQKTYSGHSEQSEETKKNKSSDKKN
jgi:hypothetical protein